MRRLSIFHVVERKKTLYSIWHCGFMAAALAHLHFWNLTQVSNSSKLFLIIYSTFNQLFDLLPFHLFILWCSIRSNLHILIVLMNLPNLSYRDSLSCLFRRDRRKSVPLGQRKSCFMTILEIPCHVNNGNLRSIWTLEIPFLRNMKDPVSLE